MARAHTTNKGKGKGIAWILAHVGHTGNECLIYPLKAHRRGYAVVGVNGERPLVGRLMCELVNGPPPTPKHEAAHSCGRGDKGCVNPKHLSWKTRAENQQDRRKHGTQGRGPNMWARKMRYRLNLKLADEIRAIGDSVSKEELGRRYGVTPSTIRQIQDGRTWSANRKYRYPITDDQVRAIRRIGYSATLRTISDQLGIHINTVDLIRRGISYRSVA